MSDQHTPGPWFAEHDQIYSGAHETNYSTNPQDAPYIWRVVSTIHGKTADELDANVRLISAAPDLLIALKLLMRETELSGNAGSADYGWPACVLAARAAIAKAEGT